MITPDDITAVAKVRRCVTEAMQLSVREYHTRFPEKKSYNDAWMFRCCVALIVKALKHRGTVDSTEGVVLDTIEQHLLDSGDAVKLRDLLQAQSERLTPRWSCLFGCQQSWTYRVFRYVLLCPMFQRDRLIASLSEQCTNLQSENQGLEEALQVERSVNQDLQSQLDSLRDDLKQAQAYLFK